MRQTDALKMLGVLSKHEVSFVVIGQFAALIHGSRYETQDVDITPLRDVQNLQRLSQALTELEALEKDEEAGELIEVAFDDQVLRLKDTWFLKTKYGELDLVINPAGLEGYPSIIKNSSTEVVGGIKVRVASLEDVIKSKTATGRQKDRAVLPELIRLRDGGSKQ